MLNREYEQILDNLCEWCEEPKIFHTKSGLFWHPRLAALKKNLIIIIMGVMAIVWIVLIGLASLWYRSVK